MSHLRSALLSVLVLAALLMAACVSSQPFDRPPLPDDRMYEGDALDLTGSAGSDALPSMPEPVGGMRAIQSEVRYPPSARRAGLEGQIRLQFLVAPDGKAYNVEVTGQRGFPRGADAKALDDMEYEAKRVIYESSWIPGMRDNDAVPVRMSWPVSFRSN